TLFVKRSLDAGKSWSDTTRVSPPGAGLVYDPRILASYDSLIYLVWEQQVRGVEMDSIRLASSRDFGQTWFYHAPLPVGGNISSLEAAVDGLGTPHLLAVLSMPGRRNQSLLHATWRNGEWVTNTDLLGNS